LGRRKRELTAKINRKDAKERKEREKNGDNTELLTAEDAEIRKRDPEDPEDPEIRVQNPQKSVTISEIRVLSPRPLRLI
jgi:hypothetical protein